MNKENIKRIDFEVFCCNSDGEPIDGTGSGVAILFNTEVIPEKEVKELIRSETYEYDNRIVVTTPKRANALAGKKA